MWVLGFEIKRKEEVECVRNEIEFERKEVSECVGNEIEFKIKRVSMLEMKLYSKERNC